MDHSTTCGTLSHAHPLSILKNTIYKYDAQHSIKVEPRFLIGGLVEFVTRYAPLTTNPSYRVQLEGDVSPPTGRPKAAQIEYPDLPVDNVSTDEPAGILDSSSSDELEVCSPSPKTGAHVAPSIKTSSPDSTSVPDLLSLDERLRELRSKKPESSVKPKAPTSQLPKVDRSSKPSICPSSSSSGLFAHESLDTTNGTTESPIGSISKGSRAPSAPPDGLPSSSVQPEPSSEASKVMDLASLLIVDGSSYPTCHSRPSGLRNLGNTCYMNAVLQALAHNRALVTFFLRGLNNNFTNATNPLGHGGKISTHFWRLFTGIWADANCSQELFRFKDLIGRAHPTFAGSDQQDSLEFLIFLLDALHEDMNEGTRSISTENEVTTKDEAEDEELLDPKDRAAKAWDLYLQNNKSIIVSSFQGQLFSSIQCDLCLKRSSRFDAFMCLTLPLPIRSLCSLQECLTLFGEPEKIGITYKCSRCKQLTNATKRLTLWRLPTYLIVQLKRFAYTGDRWTKSTTHVRFPVNDFVPQADAPHFSLYAVVNHFGTLESGHYTAFCRGISDNQWYEYDDSVVTPISESRVQSNAAYLLFYERLPRIDVFST